MSELPILSIIIVLPLLCVLYITFCINHGKSETRQIYAMYVAILGAVFTLISALYLIIMFDKNNPSYQFTECYTWIKAIGLEFSLGVDGVSLYFIFLTTLLTLICVIISLFTIEKYIKEFLFCFLLLESLCIGAFCATNLLLFFLFFEAVLIPMYLIIGIWGGENRIYSALKFFIYTFAGSVFFLLSIIYIYTETSSFDITELINIVPNLPKKIQIILFAGTLIAFAVKVPMLPLHTWLPDAHVQAPTAGSIILAGILLKLGAYAFIRITLPMFPEAVKEFSTYILLISAVTIVYASLVALAQKDMKKMIAYSSIAHMGYVTGGIFSCTEYGVSGAIFQMISHGIISSALFLIVGILYQRNHTKDISQYGGVATKMPLLAVLFIVSLLGSIGLPGTSGFIGEFFSLLGIFKASKIAMMIAVLGVIFSAVYMLALYKRIMLGQVTNPQILEFQDLRGYEMLALIPLVVLIIYFGIFPETMTQIINASISEIIQSYP